MRRPLVLLALGVAGAIGIDVLGDATQTRPDRVRPSSRTAVVFEVDSGMRRANRLMAASLWGACQSTVASRLVGPVPVALGGDRYRLVLSPELGTHARTRLTGCLHDATLDRVRGRVIEVRNYLRSEQPQIP